MRRYATIAMLLLMALLTITACSTDPLQPETNDPIEKRPPGISDPPPGYDHYLFILASFFDSYDWVEIEVEYSAKTGGVISVVPDGYPADHPIEITMFGDPSSDKTLTKGKLWVLAPRTGTYYLPGNSIIYRTQNLPPEGEPAAKIALPIMPWYNTDGHDGTFTTYELRDNEYMWPDTENEKTISMPWPPVDPEDVVYVTVEADPDKDGPNAILDQVADPQEPGEDD
jgi:hypothetical protein